MKRILLFISVLCLFNPQTTWADEDSDFVGGFVVASIDNDEIVGSFSPVELIETDNFCFVQDPNIAINVLNQVTDGIGNVSYENKDSRQIKPIYTLDGQQTDKLSHGVNIVIYTEGTKCKVIK